MIGAFPPPIHGMAAVNSAMKNFLEMQGENPAIFNIAASKLSRSLLVRFGRSLRVFVVLCTFFRFLCENRTASVYMSVSGGYGQAFEILFVVLARLWGARIVLHHHNFRYLDRPWMLTRILVCCAGVHAFHVVLCGKMAQKFKLSYASAAHIVIVSNAALLPVSSGNGRLRKNLGTVGFLGNIEEDKGIFEFLEALLQLQNGGDAISAIIAGPFFDKETEIQVRAAMADLKNVQYVGPKYGAEKVSFFNSIDVLLYPTRNDAEPLTVLEAMSHGVPVVARSRGCLEEMVDLNAGVVFEFEQDYVSKAVAQLRYWVAHPDEFSDISRGATERYGNMRKTSAESLMNLLGIMMAA